MELLEERVERLEKRVLELEKRLGKVPVTTKNQPTLEVIPPIKNIDSQQPERVMPVSDQPIKKNKDREEIIGKYITGGVASLLIFVAAVSFIALVWGRMSAELKLFLLVLISLVILGIGFVRVKKHHNAITALILGIGSGLFFINILSAYMAFGFIKSSTAFILAGAWAIFFILSYRYTRIFFITIIAYIGSYIATIFGLILAEGKVDYVVVVVFVISIAIALLISGYKWISESQQLICTGLALFSIITIYFFGSVNDGDIVPNWVLYFTILVILMHGLLHRIYYLIEKTQTIPLQVIVGAFLEIITMIGLIRLHENITISGIIGIYILILFVQLLINEWREYRITSSLGVMYGIFLVVSVLVFQIYEYGCSFGISIIALVFLFMNKRREEASYDVFGTVIVLTDTFLLLITSNWYHQINILDYIFHILILLGVVIYHLYIRYRDEKEGILIKSIGVFAFLVSIVLLTKRSILNSGIEKVLDGNVLSYLLVTILLAILLVAGYFKDWNHKQFQWFDKDNDVPQDQSKVTFYLFTTLTYFIGLTQIRDILSWYEQLIMIGSVLCLALIQSYNLLMHKRKPDLIGIWIGLKYTILTWTILGVSFHTSFDSVVISLIGLVLALLSIVIGFILRVKSLRLYGLVLTLIMASKFIIVDLSQENSIIRVLALLGGGVICFGISILYNRLNNIVIKVEE